MSEFAARVEAAVLAEVEANLEEFRTTGPALTEMVETLGEVVRAEDVGVLQGNVQITTVCTDSSRSDSSACWSAPTESLTRALPPRGYAKSRFSVMRVPSAAKARR